MSVSKCTELHVYNCSLGMLLLLMLLLTILCVVSVVP